ncbi:MAG: hypothetical protein J5744_01695 [Oscillospiraceae bacterium]|nr:hypothetical protein [Oscillospiraceae bacterium]
MSEKRYDLPEGHYASVRRFSLNDVTVVTEDPDVRRYIDVVNDELGEDGRFIVRSQEYSQRTE